MAHRWKLKATSVAFFFFFINLSVAQEAVYRCGHEYTNDALRAKSEKCKLLESGAVVSVPSHQRAASVARPVATPPLSWRPTRPQTPSAEQQKRDSDAKSIIEAELKKTEIQLADARKSMALIAPQAGGSELERKQALQQQIARHEADLVSLKRELKR